MKNTEIINLGGVEYLTRFGVAKEYLIKEGSLYRLIHSKKLQFMRHPTYGICFQREWLDDYFSQFRAARRH